MTLSPTERLASMNGGTPSAEHQVDIVRDGESIIGESTVPDRGRIDFEASNLRRERTGIHAKVVISVDGASLAYDTFNIERNEDRRKLSVQASTQLGDRKRYELPIKLRLDEFCARAWPCFVYADAPRLARGSTTQASNLLLAPYVTDSRTILFAPGGAAKSWTALIWSLCLTHGLDKPWRAPKPVRVLWVDFEDSAQAFDARLRQASNLLDCPDELLAYHFEGKRLIDVWEALHRHVAEQEVGLVVVDSISRMGLGKLIEDQAANTSVDLLNRLEVPWLALAHTARGNNGEHVYGSAHFEYGARVVIKGEPAVSPSDDGLIGLRFEVTKANHMRRGQVQTWAYRFVADELVEHRPATVGDFPDMADARPIGEKVRDYLHSVPAGATVADIADYVEASERHVKRLLVDEEGIKFERIRSTGGRGHLTRWQRVALVPETGT